MGDKANAAGVAGRMTEDEEEQNIKDVGIGRVIDEAEEDISGFDE